MSVPRYTVLVEQSVITTEKAVYIVVDEADLKAQQKLYEQELLKQKLTFKPSKNKDGSLLLHQLNKDWNV